MSIKESIINGVVNIGEGFGRLVDLKWKVEIDENKMYVKMSEFGDETAVAYDRKHFVNGNVFIKGKANPIKPIFDDAKDRVELISSKRYKSLMRNSVISDLIKSQDESEGLTTEQVALLGVVLSGVNTALLIFGAFMLMG